MPAQPLPFTGRERELAAIASALAGAGARGCVLVGEPGIGKTRLAEEALAAAARGGRATARVVGTRAAAEIPFGAVAHLVAPGAGTDRLQVLQATRDALAARSAAGRPLVLHVDDAHLLDPASAVLVHQAVLTGACAAVLTLRPNEPAPDPVTALWKDGVIERLDLAALTRAEVEALAEAALGAPLAERPAQRLWRSCAGNPLYATELVRGWQRSGALVRAGAVWRAADALPLPDALAQLVRARLDGLPAEALHALEVVAVSEPVAVELLEPVGVLDTLEGLEQDGLVVAHGDAPGAPATLRLCHPIYREALLAAMPSARLRRVSRALADAAAGAPGHAGVGPLVLARWRLQGGDRSDPAAFVDAAYRAHAAFDYALAERFARAALAAAPTFEARLALGAALTRQKRAEEAERVLVRAARDAATEPERTRAALARAHLLFFYANRQREALDLLHRTRDTLHDGACRSEIDASRSLFVGMTGNLPAAVEIGMQARAPGVTGGPHDLPALTASTIAEIMQGRVATAEPTVRAALELSGPLRGDLALWRHLLGGNLAYLYYYSGRLAEGDALTAAAYADAAGRAEPIAGFWADVRAECLLLSGRIGDGLRCAEEGAALLERWDAVGMLPVTLARRAVFHAVLGDAARATQEAVDVTGAFGDSPDVRARYAVGRARTWAAIVAGRPDEAADQALTTAGEAATHGMIAWSVGLLHDIVRIGRADAVADRIADLAHDTEAALIRVQADHAAALRDGDPVALRGCADRFERAGTTLLAAEAAAQAGVAFDAVGRAADARDATQRAAILAARCGPVRTPALRLLAGIRPPLTRREAEVAELAASGLSSAAIAARLGRSVRTVDNHLGAVYAKLGVAGRADLLEVAQRTDGRSEPA